MYFLLLVVNGRFFGKVAEKSYQIQAQQQKKTVNTNTVSSLASTLFTTILYINCGIFASILGQIPYIGRILSFWMNCMIFSYYCFE